MLVEAGDILAVRTSSGLFTWHSHTHGVCRFSEGDWVSFILSSSIWSLLLTPDNSQVYVKRSGSLLRECAKSIVGYSQNIPSNYLRERRFIKYIENKTAQKYDLVTERQIADALGIELGVGK